MNTFRDQDHIVDPVLRKTIGVAASHNPHELYSNVTPYADKTDFAIEITHQLLPQLRNLNLGLRQEPPCGFIREAMIDSQTIWDSALDDAGGVAKETALAIVKHPISTYVVAHLTGYGQNALNEFSQSPQRRDIFHISNDKSKLILGSLAPEFTPGVKGCPFAGHIDGTHNPDKIDPIFRKFTPWAGTLAVLHYFDRAADPILETPEHHTAA